RPAAIACPSPEVRCQPSSPTSCISPLRRASRHHRQFTLLRGTPLSLLPWLLPLVHILLRDTTLSLLPRLHPSEVHTPLRGTALSLLLRLLPSKDHTPIKGTSLLRSPFRLLLLLENMVAIMEMTTI
ncbi:hypothetical protein Taro_054021, partial [Colocasia esculenta]|nr:hypothetical protein [Colocasia esculenta]